MVGTIQGERYNVRQKTADKKEKKRDNKGI